MLLGNIKRYYQIRKREREGAVTADELLEKEELFSVLIEVAGSGAGLVVLSNYENVYKGYEEYIAGGLISAGREIEEEIFLGAVGFVEEHVGRYGSKKILGQVGDKEYYCNVQNWINGNGLGVEWQEEVVNGKWGVLKRGLRDYGVKKVRELNSGGGSSLSELKIEERIEPIFNKVLSQVLDEVDGGTLTAGEKLKLFDKLSYLLAEMKGERKVDVGVQVTHNNVFNVIMERKPEGKVIGSKAMELLEGEDYKLV